MGIFGIISLDINIISRNNTYVNDWIQIEYDKNVVEFAKMC